MRFLPAHFSSLLRSSEKQYKGGNYSSQFCTICKCVEDALCPIAGSSMKTILTCSSGCSPARFAPPTLSYNDKIFSAGINQGETGHYQQCSGNSSEQFRKLHWHLNFTRELKLHQHV